MKGLYVYFLTVTVILAAGPLDLCDPCMRTQDCPLFESLNVTDQLKWMEKFPCGPRTDNNNFEVPAGFASAAKGDYVCCTFNVKGFKKKDFGSLSDHFSNRQNINQYANNLLNEPNNDKRFKFDDKTPVSDFISEEFNKRYYNKRTKHNSIPSNFLKRFSSNTSAETSFQNSNGRDTVWYPDRSRNYDNTDYWLTHDPGNNIDNNETRNQRPGWEQNVGNTPRPSENYSVPPINNPPQNEVNTPATIIIRPPVQFDPSPPIGYDHNGNIRPIINEPPDDQVMSSNQYNPPWSGIGPPYSNYPPGYIGSPTVYNPPGNIGSPPQYTYPGNIGSPTVYNPPGNIGSPPQYTYPGNIGSPPPYNPPGNIGSPSLYNPPGNQPRPPNQYNPPWNDNRPPMHYNPPINPPITNNPPQGNIIPPYQYNPPNYGNMPPNQYDYRPPNGNNPYDNPGNIGRPPYQYEPPLSSGGTRPPYGTEPPGVISRPPMEYNPRDNTNLPYIPNNPPGNVARPPYQYEPPKNENKPPIGNIPPGNSGTQPRPFEPPGNHLTQPNPYNPPWNENRPAFVDDINKHPDQIYFPGNSGNPNQYVPPRNGAVPSTNNPPGNNNYMSTPPYTNNPWQPPYNNYQGNGRISDNDYNYNGSPYNTFNTNNNGTYRGGQCRLTSFPPNPQSDCCGRQATDDDRIAGWNNNRPNTNQWAAQPPRSGPVWRTKREVTENQTDANVTVENRISGGHATELYQYPWTVLLLTTFDYGRTESSFNCGGGLISAKYVLTAGHCVYDKKGSVKSVQVNLAEYDKNSFPLDCKSTSNGRRCIENRIMYAEEIIIHPQYDNENLVNDIAMLRLRGSAPYSEYIRPICLPTINIDEPEFVNLQFEVAGWGRVGQYSSNIKQSTVLHLVNHNECKRFYPQLTNKHLCAAGKRNEDTCKGDSGGPLMILYRGRYYIVGIVSGKRADSPCGTTVPSLYTNVYQYVNWIRSNIRN